MNEPGVNDDTTRLRKLIDAGRKLLPSAGGGAAGAIVGSLVAGPGGAVAGGAAGWAVRKGLEKLGKEFGDRVLAPRERARVGCVLTLALQGIQERIAAGQQIRSDGFFDATDTDRSEADEVLESVLLKSQREPEEKKLPYMANLFANIAFDSTIGAAMAHQITKTAEELTFRQLCILKLAVIKKDFALRESDYRAQGSFTKELYQILHECSELYLRGYINFGGGALLGLTDVKPASMTVQGLGADTYSLMQLCDIPRHEIDPIASRLRRDA